MEYVRPFSGLGKTDAPLSGGKGASLGEMTQAGIPVPPGFVVLAPTFDRFLAETDLVQEIDTILHTVKHDEMHTVEHASEKIQALILAATMPQDIGEAIMRAHAELGAEFVAVRSSATAEDGAKHAWAGQLDTHLNTVQGEVLRNVQRCWASLFTPRAIFYRFEKGLHGTVISVAVVVQKMVQSEVSGIAFSVHPVTEDRNQLIIEAGFGLGEAIVSGQVTPDSYVVEKTPRRIIDVNVSEQSKGLYRQDGGGNEWRELGEKGKTQVLTEAQVLELSELIIHIERHYGFPCDIEWAAVMEGERLAFYITQSRPITTLSDSKNGDMVEVDAEKGVVRVLERAHAPKTLTKLFERERPLAYMMLWYDVDRDGMARFTQQQVSTMLTIIPPAGTPGSVWYEPHELADLEAEALEKINASADLRTEMLAHTRSQWERLAPYLKEGKAVGSVDEFERLYADMCSFWFAMNTTYFRLPDHAELDAGFRDGIAAIREETQEYSNHMAEYLQESFERLVPAYARFSHHVAPSEVRKFVEGPSTELVAALERRVREGAFILNGAVYPLSQLDTVLSEHGLELEKIDTDVQEFSGAVAFKGTAKGRVRVVTSVNAIGSVQDGEILVSVLTDPQYVPAMQRAAAFITDEGGVMSHAAIVARELKKPCIIGTKIATQVLKDGDMVEVDAEKGVVRMLTKQSDSAELVHDFDPSKYVYLWSNYEESYFGASLKISRRFKNHDFVLLYDPKGRELRFYLSQDSCNRIADETLALLREGYPQWKAKFKSFFEETKKCDIDPTQVSSELSGLTLSELLERFSERVELHEEFLDNYTYYTNFFSLSKAEEIAHGDDSESGLLKEILEDLGDLKFEARGFLNIHLGMRILTPYLKELGRRLGRTDLEWLSHKEILAAASGSMVASSDLANTHWALAGRNDWNLISGRGAEDLCEKFEAHFNRLEGLVIRGIVANKGRYTGVVKVLRTVFDDSVKKEIAKVQKGDVLVASTTGPEIMEACMRAGAIITNEGGQTSHAAIVSRELGIPCIVGTKNADRVLKDGYVVEVDAESGIVTILEKKS